MQGQRQGEATAAARRGGCEGEGRQVEGLGTRAEKSTPRVCRGGSMRAGESLTGEEAQTLEGQDESRVGEARQRCRQGRLDSAPLPSVVK